MAAAKDERQSNFEQASTALNEGLETCRIVVGTYRELLAGDRTAPEVTDAAAAGDTVGEETLQTVETIAVSGGTEP